MKVIIYKGFTISVEHGWYQIVEGDTAFRFNTLKGAKARIDYWTK